MAVTEVRVSAVLFQNSVVELSKPTPLTVRVNPGPPAAAVVGEMLVMVMFCAIVKLRGAGGVCPGLATQTEAVPACTIKLAGTEAVSWVAETTVVVSGDPFHVTTVVLENPDPFAVSTKAAPPDTAELGEMLVRINGGGLIVNVTVLEVSEPDVAVTDAVPA